MKLSNWRIVVVVAAVLAFCRHLCPPLLADDEVPVEVTRA
jgi:hypothetical protein